MATYCYSAQFSKSCKNNLIGVGCSNENIYRVFDADNKNLPVVTSNYLDKAVYSVDFSNNGNLFSYGGGDGNVRILQIGKGKKSEI